MERDGAEMEGKDANVLHGVYCFISVGWKGGALCVIRVLATVQE